MKRTRLFAQVPGLERPWYVESTAFDAGERRLDIHLNFEVGGTFACGACGSEGCKAYDTALKEWRHLDFFRHRACLHAPSPRVKCPECGVRQARLPWARPPAVADRQAPCGRSEGGGGPFAGAGRGRRRKGVPPGPQLRDFLRGHQRAEAAVRRGGTEVGGAGRVPGRPRGPRRPCGGDRGAVHGHVGGIHQGGEGVVPGRRDHLRPLPRREAAERGGRKGAARRAEEAAGPECGPGGCGCGTRSA